MIRPTTPSNSSQPSIPPRSTTFPAKATHKHHIPHHAHRVHHHHHHHHRDKSVPQSAILPATSSPFGDLLPKTNSRVDGRVDGTKTPPRGVEGNERAKQVQETEERERDGEMWKEVERLRARRNAIDDDLRTRLSTLSTLSTTTTRRLDYTYYSLLSSVSSLTSAISSLSSLSAQTSALQTHFTSSSSSLTSEISNQISSSNNTFDAQARRIHRLEIRVKEGRDKAARLGDRLDGVKGKVEENSLRDKESRRMVGRRLKMLWGLLGFIAGLFMILAMTRQWRRNEYAVGGEFMHSIHRAEGGPEEVVRLQKPGQQRRRNQQENENASKPRAKTRIEVKGTTARERETAVGADAVLRLFDEL